MQIRCARDLRPAPASRPRTTPCEYSYRKPGQPSIIPALILNFPRVPAPQCRSTIQMDLLADIPLLGLHPPVRLRVSNSFPGKRVLPLHKNSTMYVFVLLETAGLALQRYSQ